MAKKAITTTKKAKTEVPDDFGALIKRTNCANPSPEDVKRIREELDKDASIAMVRANAITAHAFNRIVENTTDSVLVRELYMRQLTDKRKSLGFDDANAFVKMLIDQVLMTNFRLVHLEMLHSSKLSGGHSTEDGLYWDRRLSSAQRRFLRACETLAKAKKLLAEGERHEAHTKNLQSASSKRSIEIYKMMSNG